MQNQERSHNKQSKINNQGSDAMKEGTKTKMMQQ